jgi:hypothetical protein
LKFSKATIKETEKIDSAMAIEAMERIGCDMFFYKGSDCLFAVDEYSGYSWAH